MDHESLTYEQIAGELERLYQLDTRVMPDLRRQIEHHQDGKARWRERAREAEAKLADWAASLTASEM